MTIPSGPTVEIVEVGPRDGYQGIAPFIPTDLKISFIERLASVGLRRIEIGSFVSEKALPQLRDTHEVLTDRPSGFWTSNRPAVGGAYRYRLLLLGCAIALTTGWLTWRLVKNTKR